MKRLLILLYSLLSLAASASAGVTAADTSKIVVAYVTSGSKIIPDPTLMTHINYAFAAVSESFDSVVIENPERLRTIVALKKQNPQLKVLLSVGGHARGRFSEMAASNKFRTAFAQNCRRIADEFNLDGIDIDWEYPTVGAGGISSSPDDIQNFSKLMRSLRKALGNNLLLTCATISNGAYYDFPSCIEYLDFVNVMAYDMGNPPKHQSALYPSGIAGWMTSSKAVDRHLKKGVPASKIVLGMPLYGRGKGKYAAWLKNHNLKIDATEKWSEESQVPYLADAGDTLVYSYDNPRSLAIKCQAVIDWNLRGAMYWQYATDNAQGEGRRTIALSLLKNKKGTIAPKRILAIVDKEAVQGDGLEALKTWLDSHALKDYYAEMTYVSDMSKVGKGELDKYNLILWLNSPADGSTASWSSEAASDFKAYIDEGHGAFIGLQTGQGIDDIAGLDAFWQNFGKTDDVSLKTEQGSRPMIWTNGKKAARNMYFQAGDIPVMFKSEGFVKAFANTIAWSLFETK